MSSGGVKVDPTDPQVRRLVYNMYRGILGQYNDKANTMVNSLPRHCVTEDRGVSRQIESMMWVPSPCTAQSPSGRPTTVGMCVGLNIEIR